jgi:hypothetical protein
MVVTVLVLLLCVAIAGGFWGHSRYGYTGWSPAGLLAVVFVVLWVSGHLRV